MRMEELAKSDDFVQESIPDFLIQRGEESLTPGSRMEYLRTSERLTAKKPKSFPMLLRIPYSSRLLQKENAGRNGKKIPLQQKGN